MARDFYCQCGQDPRCDYNVDLLDQSDCPSIPQALEGKGSLTYSDCDFNGESDFASHFCDCDRGDLRNRNVNSPMSIVLSLYVNVS